MQTTTPTAREQFVNDYLLVVENDQKSWNTLTEWAQEEGKDTYSLALRIENAWEEAVIENTEQIQDETARLLMRQMLLNQGIDVFYDIAYEVQQRS